MRRKERGRTELCSHATYLLFLLAECCGTGKKKKKGERGKKNHREKKGKGGERGGERLSIFLFPFLLSLSFFGHTVGGEKKKRRRGGS